MIIRLIILISFMLIFTSYDGSCEIYKWKNDDGSMGFTDSYGKVPEKYRDQVEIKKYRSNKSQGNINWDTQHRSDEKNVYRESDTRYREEQKRELTEEEKRKLDKEIRGTWENMKDALKQGKIK